MPPAPPRSAPPPGLLDTIARKLREPPALSSGAAAVGGSLLTLSGARYGQHHARRPHDSDEDELTEPTGFDPEVAAIFEAVIEGAYLVAVSDGDFDDVERAAFEHVVLEACGGKVTAAQLRSLLTDLAALREEDGEDKRIQMVSRAISRPDQASEVLRIASLIAQVSQGVSEAERGVLDKLAARFQLDSAAVDRAIAEASRALSE